MEAAVGAPVEHQRDDLLDELGISATATLATDGTLTPAEIDALADFYLRIMAALDVERQRLAHARAQSIALIEASYAPRLATLDARYAEFDTKVKELARRADFGGKRKSRGLVFGEYGRRGSSETVKITDPDKAIPWCKAHGLGALVTSETKIVEKLPAATAKGPLLEYIKTHAGEIPDGVEYIPATDEPWAKPDIAIYAAERGSAEEAR